MDLQEGSMVDGVVYKFSPMGANVRLNDSQEGLLYKDEIYQDLKVGDRIKVYIKKIRDDGKIDLSLQKGGYRNFIDNATDMVLSKLKEAGGFLPFNDNSDPEDIQYKFQMSKKKFKETIGALYKKQVIEIRPDGIRLLENK